MPYTIEEHKHRFSAWAASRAASVKGCRFTVEQGKSILEAAGLSLLLSNPDNLPAPEEFDTVHRDWRHKVIRAAQEEGLEFSHGVAAKLINIYLKSAFICAGIHQHPRVKSIHPPIDRVLLKELARNDVGGLRRSWNEATHISWSKLNSEEYENVIRNVRNVIQKNQGLWEIEQYWQGFR